MKNKLNLMMLVLLLLGSILPLTSAYFPQTHKYLTDELLNTYKGDSEIYQTAIKYPDLVYVGNVLTDLSVVYYFVNNGAKYEVTHSPGFCLNNLRNAVGDEERACAIGSCIHGSTQDIVSHTQMVPYSIKHTGLPNSIIHVFSEQKLDNYILKKHPEISKEVLTLGDDSWNKCIPLFKKTLSGEPEYSDVSDKKLDEVINTFIGEVRRSIDVGSTGYDVSFKNKVSIFGKINLIPIKILVLYLSFLFLWMILSILLIFKKNKGILNWISLIIVGLLFIGMVIFFIEVLTGHAFTTFVNIIKPFSNFVPNGNEDAYLQQSIQDGYNFFDKGEIFVKGKQASGFEQLRMADSNIQGLDYVIISFLLFSLIILIYFNFKKKAIKEVFNL